MTSAPHVIAPLRRSAPGVLTLVAGALLASCATAPTASPESESTSTDTSAGTHTHDDATGSGEEAAPSGATESAARTPRLVLTHDGGLLVLDATTLEEVADVRLAGFNRVNPAGDGRHVLVSTSGGWAVLDAGTWTRGHGDHHHYYTAAPALTDLVVAAQEPGHVVVHDGVTSLFDDGTGHVTTVAADSWTAAVEAGEATPSRTWTAPAPHHGVAIATAQDTLLVTRGTEDSRTGAMVLGPDDTERVVSDDCPGVHGETVALETYLVVGCENGLLAFHGDHVHKIASPDAFGRIGNAWGVADSTIVLGDYKTDPEQGIGLDAISLTDVEAATMRTIDLGEAQYTWRGLARGADGEALVLGTDGVLRVLDPATGGLVRTIPVLDAWTVPLEWQTAHPALTVVAGMAYVSDPGTSTIHAVDYVGGTVWKSATLSHAGNELVGVTG